MEWKRMGAKGGGYRRRVWDDKYEQGGNSGGDEWD